MTIAHKNLTGTDLHEPKGADTATADKVYVSNGSGSGTWQKLTSSQLQTTGNPFGAQLLHVQDLRASGTAGDTPGTSTWTKKTLQTITTNEISGASLSSSQITLPAGTYFIDGTSLMAGTNSSSVRLRLRNITDSTDTMYSMTIRFATAVGSLNLYNTPTQIVGRFTIASTKVFEIQAYQDGPLPTAAFPSPTISEMYSDFRIWKVA